jgi:hypothetical protein
MLKSPMKPFFGRVVLNDIAAPPGDAYRPYDWALQHEPAE